MVYYQGEANGKSYDDMVQYGITQPLWLKRLRKAWGRDDFFFLNVMLPGFGRTKETGPSFKNREAVDAHSWAIIRESQTQILRLPYTDIINTVDLGDKEKLWNIHPPDKLQFCQRLALLARRHTLGEKDLLAAGPRFSAISENKGVVTITYTDADGLKTNDGEPPKAFWVSADGKIWTQANARISEDGIELAAVPGLNPVFVRYAYAAIPPVNLVNKADLPAYPFNVRIP